MECNHSYLLVIDNNEKVIYASRKMKESGIGKKKISININLKDILSKEILKSFQTAISQVKLNNQAMLIYKIGKDNKRTISFKVGILDSLKERYYIFYGNNTGEFFNQTELESNERIKELNCIYKVSKWIESSKSLKEFFTNLPAYLSSGMIYPDDVVVYSSYDGIEYGEKCLSNSSISTRLIVGQKEKGFIRICYKNDTRKFIKEELRMLNEIGKTLNLSLEKKELLEDITKKEKTGKKYSNRLAVLKKENELKNKQLSEQKSRKSIVDSYLERVEKEWDESKTRLETMFKAVPDDVVLLDRNRKIVMTNREDLKTGLFCYKEYFHRDKPCENCRLAKIVKDKAPLTITMKQGEKYLQVHALPVYNKDNEVDGILEFYRDISLEKSYEQQLQQADKLASLGQLVSGIGHEINNPNQFIHGNIKIIKQALYDMLPLMDEYYAAHPDLKIARLKYDFFREHISTLVDDMSHGSDRIKGIVESLRNFARKDEGLLLDKVDLNTIIEASTRLVYNEVHKQAEIILKLNEDIPVITGNSQKIEQVLVNLIVNAGHAIPEGKKGIITIKTLITDKNIIIEVRDNGKGMNENTLNQIFNPFFTTKRAQGGTGLGLPIAFRIIEEHQGTLTVKSKSGEGTLFTIRLPLSLSNTLTKKE